MNYSPNTESTIGTRGIKRFLLVIFSCFLSNAGLAGELPAIQLTPMIPNEVEQYALELNVISNNPSASKGVEELLQLGRKASDALMMPSSSRSEEGCVLELLSEEDFQMVVRKMKGFTVNRQEVVFVEPEPDFFIALAKRSRDQASLDFFEAYKTTKPRGWSIYVEQQTDYSGCIRFGSMSLVDTYKRWSTFSNRYPTRYKKEAAKFIRDVEEDLDGTCACYDKESVIREFDAFILAFPRSKIATRLRERIDQIHRGQSNIREDCISG